MEEKLVRQIMKNLKKCYSRETGKGRSLSSKRKKIANLENKKRKKKVVSQKKQKTVRKGKAQRILRK
ncbi:MAG: hypothetical protein KC736_03400 [Candidatus Moranbacteria bacterium]|nr:hypothetical protein [Candidatus Moranbacteria bacterium]